MFQWLFADRGERKAPHKGKGTKGIAEDKAPPLPFLFRIQQISTECAIIFILWHPKLSQKKQNNFLSNWTVIEFDWL